MVSCQNRLNWLLSVFWSALTESNRPPQTCIGSSFSAGCVHGHVLLDTAVSPAASHSVRVGGPLLTVPREPVREISNAEAFVQSNLKFRLDTEQLRVGGLVQRPCGGFLVVVGDSGN